MCFIVVPDMYRDVIGYYYLVSFWTGNGAISDRRLRSLPTIHEAWRRWLLVIPYQSFHFVQFGNCWILYKVRQELFRQIIPIFQLFPINFSLLYRLFTTHWRLFEILSSTFLSSDTVSYFGSFCLLLGCARPHCCSLRHSFSLDPNRE